MSARAITDVIAERSRQINVKGWSEGNDDKHRDRSLAGAAACYALHAAEWGYLLDEPLIINSAALYRDSAPPCDAWPKSWDGGWWKPKDPRRDLVRAAALIIAEIERLDRAEKVRPSRRRTISRVEARSRPGKPR